MNGKAKSSSRLLVGTILLLLLFLIAVKAQQPSPSPAPKQTTNSSDTTSVEAGENGGNYSFISTIEFGYRGLQVVGDLNKYESDLNYRTGPRLFDSTFLMR